MVKKRDLTGSRKTAARMTEKQGHSKTAPAQPMLRAMVWYKEENYQQLLAIFDDAHLLPPTFEDWQRRAEEKKNEVLAGGDRVIKVFIDPETFPEWCALKKLSKDANARSQLALEVAQSQTFTL